ncbi:MAG TPA: hypothetical protein VK498_05705 [Ferruginibacter sp.]|nr:hypothetical protein [Ferruginibacter sp.]
MRKYFILILFTGLFSCNSFRSKIEFRGKGCDTQIPNSQDVYLVNTSTTKSIKVTVRNTLIFDDSSKDYQIHIYKLNPGDEKYLGCTDESYPIEYDKKNKLVIGTYEDFKKSKDLSIRLLVEIKGMRDTIIHGEKKQYFYDVENDFSKILKHKSKKFEYAITGEVLTTNE